ncbi:hypothetical protein FD754_021959 [Muntiacus muntjak]|uniref:Interleukin family protein n=1 Tax=Muntiacus muntjak TaxID=9888 RepID=A0A5N3V787_MUNMU|nr:hypothetical protein FD754_021959 [Muntiacus muntjak]
MCVCVCVCACVHACRGTVTRCSEECFCHCAPHPSMLLSRQLLLPSGYLGCQALLEIQFYLEKVMSQAENHGPEIKEHVNSLGEMLKTLRLQLRHCVTNLFPCRLTGKSEERVGGEMPLSSSCAPKYSLMVQSRVYKSLRGITLWLPSCSAKGQLSW